jgi:hypothetical protein
MKKTLTYLLLGAGLLLSFACDSTTEVVADFDKDGAEEEFGSDNCPFISNPGQEDADGDKIGDACDDCPNDATNTCNDDTPPPPPPPTAADSDDDGVPDEDDLCPDTARGASVDEDGCSNDQMDDDFDGIENGKDNCKKEPNPEQEDDDFDGVGNLCDNCKNDDNPQQEDNNDDGFGDACPPEFPITIEVSCNPAEDELRADCLADARGRDGSQPRAVDRYTWLVRKAGELTDISLTSQEGRISIYPGGAIGCDGNDGAIISIEMTASLVSNVDHVYVSSVTGDMVIVIETVGIKFPDDLCPASAAVIAAGWYRR